MDFIAADFLVAANEVSATGIDISTYVDAAVCIDYLILLPKKTFVAKSKSDSLRCQNFQSRTKKPLSAGRLSKGLAFFT